MALCKELLRLSDKFKEGMCVCFVRGGEEEKECVCGGGGGGDIKHCLEVLRRRGKWGRIDIVTINCYRVRATKLPSMVEVQLTQVDAR